MLKQPHALLIFFIFLGLTACSTALQDNHSPYANEEAKDKAVIFAPEIVSTKAHFEINTVFNKSGDNVIFGRCTDDFSLCRLMESEYRKGAWQSPTLLPFSGVFLDADPYYNEDFSKLYFISKRPVPGSNIPSKSLNLWVSEYAGGTWQEPVYLPGLSSNSEDLYPSITATGDLYFPSFRNNQRRMYVAKKMENGFATPAPLPTHMHGENGKIGDSAVSRDGNSIIFSIRDRVDSRGNGDLYISYKVAGQWTVAKSLGDKVNTSDHEFTPILSPDGKHLFFTRIENGKGNLYQIKLSALDL